MPRCLLAAGALVSCLAAPALARAEHPVPDCRYGRTDAPLAAGRWEHLLLPEDGLFRPLLSDVKQPRISATYERVHFRGRGVPAEGEGDEIDAGSVTAGGELPIWALRAPDGCDGVQFDLMGTIFSQFNLSIRSTDLVNTDFVAGGQVSARIGAFSARLRAFHQSSHLGDEFLINNPQVERRDLGFEAIDGLLSAELGWFRLYGGGGYLTRSSSGLEPWLAQWGAEARGPLWPDLLFDDSGVQPVLGADFNALEERAWQVTTSIRGGVELIGESQVRRFRIVGVYLRGFAPYGQFFNTEKVETFGIELQYAF